MLDPVSNAGVASLHVNGSHRVRCVRACHAECHEVCNIGYLAAGLPASGSQLNGLIVSDAGGIKPARQDCPIELLRGLSHKVCARDTLDI